MKIQTSDVEVMEEAEKVFFVGRKVVTSKHLPVETLENINKYCVNQRVIYRHDDPVLNLGGAVYGRVVESTINKDADLTWLDIKAEMRQDIDKQKALIELAKKQQQLGKPIRWSVSVWRPRQGKKEFKNEILELSLTNNPVVTESTTEVINMEDDEVEKLQKEFEEKIEFIKKLEADIKQKETRILELEGLTKKSEGLVHEMKSVISSLEKANNDSVARIVALEKENDLAKRAPLIEELYSLEHDDEWKEIYSTWALEKLKTRLEKKRKEAPAGITGRVTVKSLEQSLKGEDIKEAKVYIDKIKSQISPELRKTLEW